MKVRRTAGLVGAGGVNQSFLARMPALLARLDAVKGASLRVSRRISNGLRAGTGVGEYAALQACESIWIAVPEEMLDAISVELASAVNLTGKMVVLCDSLRDSRGPDPLKNAHSRLATLNVLPESEERIFVAEGHPATLAELRRLLALDERKLIELRPATKPLYLSGIYFGAYMPLPWIAGAVDSLRSSGFSRLEAIRAVQSMGARALRAYGKAGDQALNLPAAERLHRAIERDLETIRAVNGRMALLYPDCTDRMLRYLKGK